MADKGESRTEGNGDTRGSGSSWNWNLAASLLSVGLGMISAGTVISWPSPSVERIRHGQSPVQDGYKDVTGIGYMFFLGSFAGVFIAWPIMNIGGLKPGLIISSILYFFSWVIMSLAKSLVFVYGSRFVAGMAQTLTMIMCPIYVIEISKLENRQVCGMSLLLFLNLGVLIQYSVGPFVSFHALIWLNMCLSLLYFVCFLVFTKESPYVLMSKGRRQKVKECLLFYRNNISSNQLEEEMLVIERTVSDSKALNLAQQMKCLVCDPGYRKILAITSGVSLISVFSGLSQLLMFIEPIFRLSNVTISPSLSTIVIGVVKLVGGLLLPVAIKFFGVKTMAIVSCFISSISMLCLGLFYYFIKEKYMENFTWAPLFLLIIYFFMTALGVGYVSQYIRSELFPTKVRATGIAILEIITTGSLVVCSVLFTKMFHHPYIPFWIFFGTLFAGVPFIYFFLPDSRRMTFIEISKLFEVK